jgi:hypothetical protein
MITMGDVLALRDGTLVTYVQPDPDTGQPMVEWAECVIFTVDSSEIDGESREY